MTATAGYSAFISYASENREKADEICSSLEQRGLVCWMAPRDVRAGREYADEIILGLERSAAVVLVLSEAANTSVFVLREVERAVSKEINVVPVRIEEVTPSPGLELFISGTHWLDVWRGDWDDHMDRLVRDLGDGPAGTTTIGPAAGRRSVEQPRSLGKVYVAAGLALVVALSGIAIWSFSGDTPQQAVPAVRPDTGPATDVVQDPPPTNAQEERIQPEVAPTASVNPPPRDTGGTATGRTRESSSEPISRQVAPPARAGLDTAPAALETSSALNALRDDYDNLSLRGGVIDDALNQLWEEMKPNSPRLDMVTHQRSLRTNLTRSRDALADKDAAGARRYLESARADLAALEQFLNR
jgi:TIR domain